MPRGPSSVASDCAMCSIAPLVSLYAANSGCDCHSTPELTITMLPCVASRASAKTAASRSGAITLTSMARVTDQGVGEQVESGRLRKALSSIAKRPRSVCQESPGCRSY